MSESEGCDIIASVVGGVNEDIRPRMRRKVLDFMTQGDSRRHPRVSVVVPLHNEVENVDELVERVLRACERYGDDAELILVDDGSTDATPDGLRAWHRRAPRAVGVVVLRARSGQHAALLAGLRSSAGAAVVTLDGDLQDPPEEIPRFVARIERGVDLVSGRRVERTDSLHRRLLSGLLRRVGPVISGVPAHDYGCMFRGYSRPVVESVLRSRALSPYVPVLAHRAAHSFDEVTIHHQRRGAGRSKYDLRSLLRLALDLSIGSSEREPRTIGWIGAGIAITAALLVGAIAGGAARLLGTGPSAAAFAAGQVALAGGSLLAMRWILGSYIASAARRRRAGPVPAIAELLEPHHRSAGRSGAPRQEQRPPRVLLCGFREVGHFVLGHLIEKGAGLVAVATHRESEEDRRAWPSVIELAARHHIPVLLSDRVRSERFERRLAELGVDLIVSAYYRRILPPAVLALATRGAFNLHPSLLPAYRGRAPINWALLRGEKETGVTIHEMTERPDAGPIVAQRAVAIAESDDAATLSVKMARAAAALFEQTWPSLCSGSYTARPQDESKAFWVEKRGPEDGRIDWCRSAAEIYNLVRAVARPFPGAFTGDGGDRLTIWRAVVTEAEEDPAELPGAPLCHDGRWAIACGDGGWLVPLEIEIGGAGSVQGRALEIELAGWAAGRSRGGAPLAGEAG